jgi:hypothetical protein
MVGMVLDPVADELDRLHERIADRVARAEPRGSGIEVIPWSSVRPGPSQPMTGAPDPLVSPMFRCPSWPGGASLEADGRM